MASKQNPNHYYIGVDVGTGSARAALVTCNGEIVAESTYPTTTYRDDHNHDIFEQSTTESESPFHPRPFEFNLIALIAC